MLMLLLAIFAAPFLIVMAMYHFEWRPGGTSHGVLIAPPRALANGTLPQVDGGMFPHTRWVGKWTLVHVGAENCPRDCLARLHEMRQVHASMNKEIDRLQRVLLLPEGITRDVARALHAQYPDLIMLAGPGVAAFARQFSPPAALYLVDPLGNLMMYYPDVYEPQGLRNDLTRLLKYSWAG